MSSRKYLSRCVAVLSLAAIVGYVVAEEYQSGRIWPEPKIITPGDNGVPPSDALVLFGGTDLSHWNGGEKWLIENGGATVRGGSITTKQAFGSCQLHVEWAAPAEVKGEGQGRGNSGIYLMGHYEVQVLDSYNNVTYFDGQAGSLYKQWPPLVNACRKPGEWQTYDIVFDAPRFDPQGKLLSPAYVTVLHNGVVIQNHSELMGTTAWDRAPVYEPHADKLPISIQDHGNPVRFRNIWVRELVDREAPQQAATAAKAG
jgi:hypothetical protein